MIVGDRNYAPETAPERIKQLDQLLDWMEEDLAKLLERLGYLAAPSRDPSLRPAANRYLLRLEVTQYQGVSRAARLATGAWGTGGASLIMHFELTGLEGVVQSGDPSIAGASDWAKAARVVNVQIRDAVNGRLRLSY